MTPILHLTHGKNLESILAASGLWSNHHRPADVVEPRSIAYEGIQSQRSSRPVPVGPGGVLHDYVPFYFGERSPMLFAHHCGKVPGNPDGQRPLVYLVSSVERVVEAGLGWVFTDGHAIMRYTEFHDQLGALGALDWETIHARDWFDSEEDPDRKRRKQAEFLVHRFFPWSLVERIVTFDAAIARRVETILQPVAHKPPVSLEGSWYY